MTNKKPVTDYDEPDVIDESYAIADTSTDETLKTQDSEVVPNDDK